MRWSKEPASAKAWARVRKARDASSSDGFGGIGPLVRACRWGIDVDWISCSTGAFPLRYVDRPRSLASARAL